MHTLEIWSNYLIHNYLCVTNLYISYIRQFEVFKHEALIYKNFSVTSHQSYWKSYVQIERIVIFTTSILARFLSTHCFAYKTTSLGESSRKSISNQKAASCSSKLTSADRAKNYYLLQCAHPNRYMKLKELQRNCLRPSLVYHSSMSRISLET